MNPARLTSSAPVLLVRDLVAAANHYRDALGFTYERFWGEPPDFVILRRNGLHLMLSLAPAGHIVVPNWKVNGIWNVYFWVSDVDGLFSEFQQNGATIDYGLEDKPYQIREFGIRDLDGYDIGFGQPIVPSTSPITEREFAVNAIGRVQSSLQNRAGAPKQGEEGSPRAVLIFEPSVKDALSHVQVGDRLLLLTWLDRADRTALQVHPRDDQSLPLRGVFSTRSQDRPNPIGVHRVTVVSILDPLRFQVRDLEAFDNTPIIDVKSALDNAVE